MRTAEMLCHAEEWLNWRRWPRVDACAGRMRRFFDAMRKELIARLIAMKIICQAAAWDAIECGRVDARRLAASS